MKLWQKIKSAFSCCPGNDDTSWPTGQCSYNGKQATFTRLLPYGLSALEPDGSFVLVVNSQGQEAVKFGIPSAMQDRLKNLKQGEVAIYNSITQTYVMLLEDGTFEINCDGLITGNLEINGDVTINGNLVVSGIDFLTHVHGGVSTGSGDTGVPK